MTKLEREQIRNMFGGKCAYCGKTLGKTFHADHVVPLFRGYPGESERKKTEEFYPACVRCNLRKGTLSVEQFRAEIAKQVERVRRDSAGFRLAEDFGLIVEMALPVEFYFETYDQKTEKPL